MDLFPVVDPAVDWVREIDTDLVGCGFSLVIWEGGVGEFCLRKKEGCRGRRRRKEKDIERRWL